VDFAWNTMNDERGSISMKKKYNRSLPPICLICVGTLGAACFLGACGSSSRIEVAKQAVERFHSQLNSEQYSGLYTTADDKFLDVTSESDFTRLLQSVHQKLGNVQASKLRNTGVTWSAGQGATVTLVYDTRFAAGSGAEQFIWHISDHRAKLYGYHINSNELVTR
jgi:hypothetical protein